jgi:hypothetical protein
MSHVSRALLGRVRAAVVTVGRVRVDSGPGGGVLAKGGGHTTFKDLDWRELASTPVLLSGRSHAALSAQRCLLAGQLLPWEFTSTDRTAVRRLLVADAVSVGAQWRRCARTWRCWRGWGSWITPCCSGCTRPLPHASIQQPSCTESRVRCGSGPLQVQASRVGRHR